MASQDAERSETRPPTIDDLITVCKQLNKEKVKYVSASLKNPLHRN